MAKTTAGRRHLLSRRTKDQQCQPPIDELIAESKRLRDKATRLIRERLRQCAERRVEHKPVAIERRKPR